MPEVKINLNDSVKVKLTDAGVDILKKQHKELYAKILMVGGEYSPFALRLDGEGHYEAPLWWLFKVFGEHISPGVETPIEGLDIIVR